MPDEKQPVTRAVLEETLTAALEAQDQRFERKLLATLEAQDQRFERKLLAALEAQDQRFERKVLAALEAQDQRFELKLRSAMEVQDARRLAALEAQDQRSERKLLAALEAQDARFQGRLDTVEMRLRDYVVLAIRETETHMLQAFYSYAEASDKHLRQHDADISMLLSRLGSLESRVTAVEKRLNIPPAS